MYELIKPSATLTRYVPFVKLISMLEQGFFIPKTNLFDDDWEGSLHLFNSEEDRFQTKEKIKSAKDWTYVSCWYLDEPESHAMWNSYGQSNDSLAIQTTHQDFKLACSRSKTNMLAYFDRVRYQEPDTAQKLYNDQPVMRWYNNEFTVSDPIFAHLPLQLYYKHKAFSFENEARLVLVDNNTTLENNNEKIGFHLLVEHSKEMISKIILHPNSSAWFEDTVRKLINDTYKLDIPIWKSSLVGHKN